MPADDRPRIEHVYQNHHLDSTRWDHVTLRPDDIVISTAYKAGTTFAQTIVGELLFWGSDTRPEPLLAPSSWIEMRRNPIEEVAENLAGQQHRRFLKSHVGLDGIPYREDVRYMFVGRDPRDVFMSLWNHYSNHTDEFVQMLNETPGRVGAPFPWPPPDDPRELFQDWITRGWFDWESDGWPYWSMLHHALTWWRYRHLPNILCVHYADLLADLEAEVRRIATFLDIERPESAFAEIAEACRFDTAKKNAERITGDMSWGFKGGTETFFHKGTNGRWKQLLTEADLGLYHEAMAKLPADLTRWLEEGGPPVPS
jgi:aryl sulfotransferase